MHQGTLCHVYRPYKQYLYIWDSYLSLSNYMGSALNKFSAKMYWDEEEGDVVDAYYTRTIIVELLRKQMLFVGNQFDWVCFCESS